MSSTSGSFGFALGGSATSSQSWQSKAAQAATCAATTPQLTYNTAANAALTTAGVNTTGHACIKGILRVSAPGTVIPEACSLTVPAAAVVAANSYFKVSPLGSSGLTNVGIWS